MVNLNSVLFWALTIHDLRAQTRASSGREPESSAAAVSGAAQPAAQPFLELSPHKQSGQSASRRNKENSPTK